MILNIRIGRSDKACLAEEESKIIKISPMIQINNQQLFKEYSYTSENELEVDIIKYSKTTFRGKDLVSKRKKEISRKFFSNTIPNGFLFDFSDPETPSFYLGEAEPAFLKLACSKKTYFEIAKEMFVSERTADGYQNSLFEKLNVKSRVGLALYAVKHGLVQL
jgi:DNA-binding NarL/FixJ family response regulator